MCLGVLGRVVEVNGMDAIVDIGGFKKKASAVLVEGKVKPGDYVIIHAGFILQILDEKEALEMMKIREEVFKLAAMEPEEMHQEHSSA